MYSYVLEHSESNRLVSGALGAPEVSFFEFFVNCGTCGGSFVEPKVYSDAD